MPYIEPRVRKDVEPKSDMPALSAGELNYQITRLCDHYLRRTGVRYESLNAVIGALECAKLELYRRIGAPYEDTKWNINGDVYGV